MIPLQGYYLTMVTVENRMDVKYITGNISEKDTKNSHNLLALALDEC